MASSKKEQKGKKDPLLKDLMSLQKLTDDMNMKVLEELRFSGSVNALLPEDLRRKHEELERKAEEDLIQKVIKHKKKVLSNIGSYDDGDQSPLKGDEAQFLRYQWSSGMDCNPLSPYNDHLSSWLRALWWGDYDEVMSYITRVSEDQLSKLLENRESLMNVSAIFHVIIGARTFRGDNKQVQKFKTEANKIRTVKEDHEKIMKKLLELGANINARDVAGNTPLHHCLTSVSNSITRSMARELLNSGADPNTKNRFGCTPLYEPVQAANLDSIKLLLEFGADPDIEDNDGLSCRKLGHHSKVSFQSFG